MLRELSPVETVVDAARSIGGRVLGSPGRETLVVEYQSSPSDRVAHPDDLIALLGSVGLAADARLSVSRAAFLDIETTGLNAGAGTLVFLVGLATIDGDVVNVRQFFLHEPAGEPDLLASVTDELRGCDVLLTFNGRRFDVPLLVGRYDLHGIVDPVPGRHIDLLQPARRIWGKRLGQSNLATLESRVLGVRRYADVPGSEAPGRYFSYLHERRIDAVIPVIEHNRQDLLSMVRLACRIGGMLGTGRTVDEAFSSDLLGLGSLFEDAGRTNAATTCYESALIGASTGERADALFRLARLTDRGIALERVIQLLATVADYNVERAIEASIELAKILEHRKREPELALRYACRALALARSLPSPAIQRLAPEIRFRIARLERKVARVNGTPSS